MTWSSIALDAGALVVVILCAVFYAKQGFLSGLFSFFGTLAAVVASALLARHLSPLIFEHYLSPGISEKITEAVAGQEVDISGALNQVIGFLPAGVLDSLTSALNGAISTAAPGVAAAVENVVRPLVVPLITAVLFFVLFLAARLLVMALRALTRGLNRVPVISTLNSALGAVMGVLVGAMYVFLALLLIWAFDAINPQMLLKEQYFARSVLYGIAGQFNFLG